MSAPPLSVVMPVYNALPFLDAGVESVLRQSFRDFEFVIFDDGSTDGSAERLREHARRDARIRLVESPANLGPVASSNRVVAESRAPLVARMDADDLCSPDRLAVQMKLAQAEPDAVLIGALYDTIDARGRRVRPADYARLVRPSPFGPFAHASILFRRDAFERAGGYSDRAARWEDVDLYRKMAQQGRILVVARPLVSLRVSAGSSRLGIDSARLEEAMDDMYRLLRPGLGARRQGGRLLPHAFLPGASIRVWNGERPRLLRRLLRRGALRPDLASARMLIWAVWADLSPKSLRLFLKGIVAARNRPARRRIGEAPYVEWKPTGRG